MTRCSAVRYKNRHPGESYYIANAMHIMSDNDKMEIQRGDRSVRNIFPQYGGHVPFTTYTPIRPNCLQVPAEPNFPVTQCLWPHVTPSKNYLHLLLHLVNFSSFFTLQLKQPPGGTFPHPSVCLNGTLSTPALQCVFHCLLKLLTCWFCLLEIRDYGFFILAYPGSLTVPGTLETKKTMFDCVLRKAVFITVSSWR